MFVLYRCMLFTMYNDIVYARAVRKVSSHFEYLENRSRDLYVTWQPVRGDLLCIREQSFSRWASQPAVKRR